MYKSKTIIFVKLTILLYKGNLENIWSSTTIFLFLKLKNIHSKKRSRAFFSSYRLKFLLQNCKKHFKKNKTSCSCCEQIGYLNLWLYFVNGNYLF